MSLTATTHNHLLRTPFNTEPAPCDPPVGLGSEGPSWFTAITRKAYSVPGSSPSTWPLQLLPWSGRGTVAKLRPELPAAAGEPHASAHSAYSAV